jgi:hypothetical protein
MKRAPYLKGKLVRGFDFDLVGFADLLLASHWGMVMAHWQDLTQGWFRELLIFYTL